MLVGVLHARWLVEPILFDPRSTRSYRLNPRLVRRNDQNFDPRWCNRQPGLGHKLSDIVYEDTQVERASSSITTHKTCVCSRQCQPQDDFVLIHCLYARANKLNCTIFAAFHYFRKSSMLTAHYTHSATANVKNVLIQEVVSTILITAMWWALFHSCGCSSKQRCTRWSAADFPRDVPCCTALYDKLLSSCMTRTVANTWRSRKAISTYITTLTINSAMNLIFSTALAQEWSKTCRFARPRGVSQMCSKTRTPLRLLDLLWIFYFLYNLLVNFATLLWICHGFDEDLLCNLKKFTTNRINGVWANLWPVFRRCNHITWKSGMIGASNIMNF